MWHDRTASCHIRRQPSAPGMLLYSVAIDGFVSQKSQWPNYSWLLSTGLVNVVHSHLCRCETCDWHCLIRCLSIKTHGAICRHWITASEMKLNINLHTMHCFEHCFDTKQHIFQNMKTYPQFQWRHCIILTIPAAFLGNLHLQHPSKPSFIEDKDAIIVYNEYRVYWWPRRTRGQGIGNHAIELFLNNRRVNIYIRN